MAFESSDSSISQSKTAADHMKVAAGQSSENLQEYVSYLRGCPEKKVGNPYEAVGLYIRVPEGSFAENLESQSQRLANLLAPSCSDRKPFAAVELNRVHEWAAQFGPSALQNLSEATNKKLEKMGSDVRMNIASRFEMEDMVKVDPRYPSKVLDQVRISVHDSKMQLTRGKNLEYEATIRTLPAEYRTPNWTTKELHEIFKTIR